MQPLWLGKDLAPLMGLGWLRVARVCFVSAALLVACSSVRQPSPRDVADANDTGRGLTAASEAEREIIRQLPQLREGAEVRVRDFSVVGDPAYSSASGRTCRALHLTQRGTGKVQHRLACSEGSTWFFVPDVLGAENSKE